MKKNPYPPIQTMSFGLGLIFFMAGNCTNSWWSKIRAAKDPKNIDHKIYTSLKHFETIFLFRLSITSFAALPMSPEIVRVPLANRRWYNFELGRFKEVIFQTFARCVPLLRLVNWVGLCARRINKNGQNSNVPGMRSHLRISLPAFPWFSWWNPYFWHLLIVQSAHFG